MWFFHLIGKALAGLYRFGHRYRWQLTPLYISALLAGATLAGRAEMWSRNLTLLAVVLLAFGLLALGVQQFSRATDRLYIAAATAVAAVLALAGVYLPSLGPIPVLWLVATILFWLAWMRHERVRMRIRTQKDIEGWPGTAARARLGATMLLNIVHGRGVREFVLRRADGMPHNAVSTEALNDAMRLPPGTVKETRVDPNDSSITRVIVAHDPPWGRDGKTDMVHPLVVVLPELEAAELAAYEATEAGNPLVKAFGNVSPTAAVWAPGARSCRSPHPIAQAADGSVTSLYGWLPEIGAISELFVGVNGSGKSTLGHDALAASVACRDELVWAVQIVKAGAAFRPWVDVIDWVALTRAQAEDLLLDALTVVNSRPAAWHAAGHTGKVKPSPRWPLLTIDIEEAPEVLKDATLYRLVLSLAQLGRESGVRLRLRTQRSDGGSIPTAIRAQMRTVAALRMDSRDVGLALPDHANEIDQNAFNVAGSVVVRHPLHNSLSPVSRTYSLTDDHHVEDMRRIAGLYKPYRPTLEPTSVAATRFYSGRPRDPYAKLAAKVGATPRERITVMTKPSEPEDDRTSMTGGFSDDPAADLAAAQSAAGDSLQRARQALQESFAGKSLPSIPLGALVPDTPYEPAPNTPEEDLLDSAILGVLRMEPTGLQRGQIRKAIQTVVEEIEPGSPVPADSTITRRLTALEARGKVTRSGRAPAGVRWHPADNT